MAEAIAGYLEQAEVMDITGSRTAGLLTGRRPGRLAGVRGGRR